MSNRKKSLVSIFTSLVILFLPLLTLAQGPGGGDLPDDPGVPIDGGASLLIGAAAIYGAKKLKDRRAKQK